MSKDLALWLGFGLLALLFLAVAIVLAKLLGWKTAAGVMAAAAVVVAAIAGAEVLIAWGLTS